MLAHFPRLSSSVSYKMKKPFIDDKLISWEFIRKSRPDINAINIDDLNKFIGTLHVEKWDSHNRKTNSLVVARFLCDYYKTNNLEFANVLGEDSIYLRIPAYFNPGKYNQKYIYNLFKKTALYSKQTIVSYPMMQLVHTLDGWDLSHSGELGSYREMFPDLLKVGKVLFLPNYLFIGRLNNEGKQELDMVFDITDIEHVDINLNNNDVWKYFLEDVPYQRSGSLAISFPSTKNITIEEIYEIRDKYKNEFEYFLRCLNKMLSHGKEGCSEKLRKSISEVSEGVRFIECKYQEHKMKKRKILIEGTLASVSLAIGLISHNASDTFRIISAIIGSSAIRNLINYYMEGDIPFNVKNDPFFIPWHVHKLNQNR